MKQLLLIVLTLTVVLGESMAISCFAAEPDNAPTPTNPPNQTAQIQPKEPASPPPDWDSTGGVIVEMKPSIYPDFILKDIPYGETDFATLQGYLANSGLDCIWQRGEERYSLILPIRWNYDLADPFLSDTIQILPGSAILPEGTAAALGVDISTSIQFQVEATTPIELVSFQAQPLILSLALPQNQPDALTDYFAELQMSVIATDQDGNEHKLTAENWDLSKVELSQLGVYLVTAVPTIKGRYVVAEGVELPTLQHLVSVQTPGKPDINTCYLMRGRFFFPWLLSDEQLDQTEQFSVWLRGEGEKWEPLSEDAYNIGDEEFTLSASTLISDKNYELQIDYPGGQTGILSFYYNEALLILGYSQGDRDGNDNDDDTLDPPLTQPPPIMPPENGGDTGGSDGENGGSGDPSKPTPPTSPPVTPPATPVTPPVPSPPPSNGEQSGSGSSGSNNSGSGNGESATPPKPPVPITPPKNEATGGNSIPAKATPPTASSPKKEDTPPTEKDNPQGYEQVDGDMMKISGARLAWLLKSDPPFLPLGWNEVSLEMPTAFLKKLSLTPADMLTVALTRESALCFTVTLSAKETAVTELESTLVRLPVPKPQGTYTLSLSGNKLETPVVYENGNAVFSITQTGTFTLIDEPIPLSDAPKSPPFQEPNPPPALPEPAANDFLPLAVTGAVLLLGGGFWLWRRRR